MSTPEPLNPNIITSRRLAQRVTPRVSFKQPHLDPNVPEENLGLVPPALFAGRKLNWELPRPTEANLHIVLRLANDPNNVLKEFHDKIPQIQDVLGRWSEVKAASPTSTGEAQLRARAPIGEERDWISREVGKGTTFNLVSSLDSRGRADIIYLANAAEDSREHAESMPRNLRTMEWLGFDGSYVHLEDAEPKKAAIPVEQDSNFDEHVVRRSSIPSNLQSTGLDIDEHSMRRNNTPSNLRNTEWLDDGQPKKTSFRGDQDFGFDGHSMRRDSTPSNLRVTEWLDDAQYADLDAYSLEPQSDAENTSSETGPYETFWINHKGLSSRCDQSQSNSNASQ